MVISASIYLSLSVELTRDEDAISRGWIEKTRISQCLLTDLFINHQPRYHLGKAKSRIAGTNGSDDFPGFCRSVDRAASTRSGNRHSLRGGARSCSCSCSTRSDFLRGNCTIQSGVTSVTPVAVVIAWLLDPPRVLSTSYHIQLIFIAAHSSFFPKCHRNVRVESSSWKDSAIRALVHVLVFSKQRRGKIIFIYHFSKTPFRRSNGDVKNTPR